MKHLRRIFLKFYLLFANSKVEAELAREIGAHLALLEDEYLRQGMTPEDARRAARIAYGGVEQAKQLHRDERGFQGTEPDSARHSIYLPPTAQVSRIYSDGHPDAGAGHRGDDGDFFHRRGSTAASRCRFPTRIVWSSWEMCWKARTARPALSPA